MAGAYGGEILGLTLALKTTEVELPTAPSSVASICFQGLHALGLTLGFVLCFGLGISSLYRFFFSPAWSLRPWPPCVRDLRSCVACSGPLAEFVSAGMERDVSFKSFVKCA